MPFYNFLRILCFPTYPERGSVVYPVPLYRSKQSRWVKIRLRVKIIQKIQHGVKITQVPGENYTSHILSLLWLKCLFQVHRRTPGPGESPIFHSFLLKPGSKLWQTTIDNERRLTVIEMRMLRYDHIQNEGICNRNDPWSNPWWKQRCLIC